jgi:outer membrane biosynthesis protein TonB
MLVARATSRAVRRYCSDALVGGGLTEDEVESLDVAEVDQVQPAAVIEAEVIEDAEIVEEAPPIAAEPPEAPKPPAAPARPEPDADPEPPSPQLKGTTKAAVELCKGQGRYSELAEALKAADIPLSSQRWTKADCTQILAIVETIPPADTDLIEED